MLIEETSITPTVDTHTPIHVHQQSSEMRKTNDLGFVRKDHSQLINAKRYRLLNSNGPNNMALLDIVRQNRRKFL